MFGFPPVDELRGSCGLVGGSEERSWKGSQEDHHCLSLPGRKRAACCEDGKKRGGGDMDFCMNPSHSSFGFPPLHRAIQSRESGVSFTGSSKPGGMDGRTSESFEDAPAPTEA